MLDIFARLFISTGIMIGTAYLPLLAPAATAGLSAGTTAKVAGACPARRDMSVRACIA